MQKAKQKIKEILSSSKNKSIVFFTGAGMSAESGVPVYRGEGGVWHEYDWEEYACQKAFDDHPEKVLDFHELRRESVLACQPHIGHKIISNIENNIKNVTIITQNIDGMHQRVGSNNIIELHGSLWRMRCEQEGKAFEDIGEEYKTRKCNCGEILRPDITWFEDMLNEQVLNNAIKVISKCDLFISIGTSAVVYPASELPIIAKNNNAFTIEINPELTMLSKMYDKNLRMNASDALVGLFDEYHNNC